MKATKKQKQLIHIRIPNREERETVLGQFLAPGVELSCNSLNFTQANALLEALGIQQMRGEVHYGRFDRNNGQHMYILSLLRQIGWTTTSNRYGVIADIDRFGRWLQSKRSPVRKPLMKMNKNQTTTIINALEGMLVKK